MEQVFGFVHVPDLYQCPAPCFRKLVSAILRSLYSHLSKNIVRDLYAARDVKLVLSQFVINPLHFVVPVAMCNKPCRTLK